MMEMITKPREIGVIVMEIKALENQANQMVLNFAIEIGRRLAEAKAQLPHGEWGKWLKEEVNFSQSKANGLMNVFEAYSTDQLGLFGSEAKSQTLGNLTFTKALKLLAVPEDEREEFVEANHVEDLSTRELDKLIKERDAAIKRATDAENAVQLAEEGASLALAEKQDEINRLKKLEAAAETATFKVHKAEQEAEQARLRADEAAKALAELQNQTVEIPKETITQIEKSAQEAANMESKKELERQKALADIELKKAQEAEQKAKDDAKKAKEVAKQAKVTAEQAVEQAKAEAEAAKKELSMANPVATEFKVHFTEVKNRCETMLELIEKADDVTKHKLKGGLVKLLESVGGALV